MRFFFQAMRPDGLDESNGLIRFVMDAMPGLVVYADAGLTCRFFNARYQEWFNRRRDEALGLHLSEALGKELYASLELDVRRALAGNAIQVPGLLTHIDRRRVLRVDISPDKDENGTVNGLFLLLMDETQEHDAREALRVSHETALAADEAKSRFLAAASHDLRQPIHALTLFASALARRVKDDENKRLVANMQATLDSLTRMFNALLDLSKIDSGLVNVEIGDVVLGDVLARIESEFRAQAEERGIDLRVVTSHLSAKSDPILLENILRNLVANALKFTAQGRILVGVRRSGSSARIEVHDTGPGIADARRATIFDAYERSRDSAEGPNTGLGLGLAIVKRLAALIGCSVSVESHVGKGSTFSIEVPDVRQSVAGRRVTETAPDLRAIRDARIMIVDDDELILAGLEAELSGLGGQVIARNSADSLYDSLDKGGWPDLILIDYHLDGSNTALTCLDEIRARFGFAPPAIIISGSTDPETIRAIEQSGHGWLTKPVSPDGLQAATARALSAD